MFVEVRVRKWSLDHLTVAGVRPRELVEIAARAGYDAVGPFIGIGDREEMRGISTTPGDPDGMAMARHLADAGLFINNVDGFNTSPAVPLDKWRAGVDAIARLGARSIVLHQVDEDLDRGFDRYRELSDYAAEAGLGVVLEFTPLTKVATLDSAIDFLGRLGLGHVGILADILHLYRSGGGVGALRMVDPDLIKGAQLSDARAQATQEEYWREAIFRREVPGEGELPVVAFLAALPPDIVVGVEVPDRSQERSQEQHIERARTLLAGARALAGSEF